MIITKKFSHLVEINPLVPIKNGHEYPFVAMEDITPGRRYITGKRLRKFAGGGARFQAGDVLFARITPCLENGKIAQFLASRRQLGFGSTEFFVFRHKEGVSDAGYVFYLVLTDIVRKPAEKSMKGASGRQRADLASIRDLEVPAPPLPVQRKISATLSTYDDLMENNIRRIRILEEIARNIYHEWFVNFRFPGHETVKMVDSELGPIPEGWVATRVSDAVEISPETHVLRDTKKIYVPMSGLSTNSMMITEFEVRAGNGGSKFKNRDTLFARITPSLEHGKTGFVQFLESDNEVAIGSTEFIVFRSRTLNPYYVYFLSRNEDLRRHAIKSMIGASGRQRVQVQCFDHFYFAHPDDPALEKFADFVSPLFRGVHLLWRKNQILRHTRDFLLPRLVSGEIEVSGSDINTEGLES